MNLKNSFLYLSLMAFLTSLFYPSISSARSSSLGTSGNEVSISLFGEQTGVGLYEMPLSTVKIKLAGAMNQEIVLSEKTSGNCSRDSTKPKQSLTSLMCWWAGAGEEYGIFKQKDQLLVKSRTCDEGEEVCGPFKIVKRIPLLKNILQVKVVDDKSSAAAPQR